MPGAILKQPSPNLLLSSVAVGVVSRNNLPAWGLGDLCLGKFGRWLENQSRPRRMPRRLSQPGLAVEEPSAET